MFALIAAVVLAVTPQSPAPQWKAAVTISDSHVYEQMDTTSPKIRESLVGDAFVARQTSDREWVEVYRPGSKQGFVPLSDLHLSLDLPDGVKLHQGGKYTLLQGIEYSVIYAKPDANSTRYSTAKHFEYLVGIKGPEGWWRVPLRNGRYGYASHKSVIVLPYRLDVSVPVRKYANVPNYSTTQVANSFASNEIASEDFFIKRKVVVTGTILKIGVNKGKQPYLILDRGIVAEFSPKQRKLLSPLRSGQTVEVLVSYKSKGQSIVVFTGHDVITD